MFRYIMEIHREAVDDSYFRFWKPHQRHMCTPLPSQNLRARVLRCRSVVAQSIRKLRTSVRQEGLRYREKQPDFRERDIYYFFVFSPLDVY